MKLSRWAFLFLAATAVLFGQRADASYTRLDTGLHARETALLQTTATAPDEHPADVIIVENITPIGHTEDGQPLALISLLIPTAHLAEHTPASTRAGPYAAPETHTRVFCIVQPPLGLYWEPQPGKLLPVWRSAGYASVGEELIMHHGYNSLAGVANFFFNAQTVDAATPHPEDFVKGSQMMSQGMFGKGVSWKDRGILTGLGLFTGVMGVIDVVDVVPDFTDAIQKAGREFGTEVLEKTVRETSEGVVRSSRQVAQEAMPKGVPFEGTVWRYEFPERMGTTWQAGDWNVKVKHRYSEEGVGATYGGLTKATAKYEVGVEEVMLGRVATRKKVSFSNVLDLRDAAARKRLGVSLSDITGESYEQTQRIGRLAREHGYEGIIAPSARFDGRANLVIFGGL